MKSMKTLVETNPFLRDARIRRRMLEHNALESAIFEGANRLRSKIKAKPHSAVPQARGLRAKAASKKAVKGS